MDARQWSPEVQEHARRQLVMLVRDRGMAVREAAELVGFARATAYRILAEVRESGDGVLGSRRRGPRVGEHRLLSSQQQQVLVAEISGRSPAQLMIPGLLWSREAVRELVERQTGVRMALRTVSTYLARWGFSAKKPVWRVYLQEQEAVRRFVEEDYPKLARRAVRERARIFFLDQSGLRVDDVRGRSFAPRGQRAVAAKAARKPQVNVMHAIHRSGEHFFDCYTGTLESERFCDFLAALYAQADAAKLIVVCDNLNVHRSAATRAWLEEQEGCIELVFLPPYAPELNPVEYGNNAIKQELSRQPDRPLTTADLKERATNLLQRISNEPQRVARWFHARQVMYTLRHRETPRMIGT